MNTYYSITGKTLMAIVVLVLLSVDVYAQSEAELEYQRLYEERILMTHINDVYIPKDLEDSFLELVRLSDSSSIRRFQMGEEAVVARRLHFGLGKWMIINWGFYDGSRLSHYLKRMGIHHPDDMAKFVIVSFHRHLNDQPQEFKKRIELIQTKRRELIESRITERDTIRK